MNVTGDSTDVTTYFKLHKTADGLEATGLTISDFDMQYTRTGEIPTAKVDAVALAATNTAHTDGRGIEVDATDQPGVYRFDWPDAAFVSGVKQAILTIKHASCWTEELAVAIDPPVNVTKLNGGAQSLTDLKDFADDGYDPSTNKVQGLVLADTTSVLTNLPAITANWLTATGIQTDAFTAAKFHSDFTTEMRTGLFGGDYALSTDANGRIRIVDGTAAGELDTASGLVTLAATQAFNNTGTWTGNITGNLSGSVGSVTGGVTVTTNNDKTGYQLSATGVDDVWDEVQSGHATAGSFGLFLDATISSRGTGTALDAAAVRSAVGLASANLDTQLDALPTANEVRNAITGGSYALDTDANGRVRIVDGTATGELDTSAGLVSVVASSVRSAVGLASANLDTQLDALPTAAENAAALLDLTDGVETGVTPRQSLRAMAAVLCGKIADAGTGTETFKGIGVNTTRVTGTIDASGNRSVMLLSL